MNHDLFNKLVAPIPGDHPCGEDVSFLPVFDQIREARRQDDPALSQGDWETELKSAQWPKVRQLCEDVLQNGSKDLQVACWYTEALTHLHGFQGLAIGFQLLEVLLNDFWEFFYPELDTDDLEERAGKIDWLNKQLPLTIRSIPLTDKASGGYSWLKWQESRAVDNLGLKDGGAKEKAIAEGKLSGEIYDKAVTTSGLAFYESLQQQLDAARDQVSAVEKHIEQRFGANSPGLKEVRDAVTDCHELVVRTCTKLGGKREAAPSRSDSASDRSAPQSLAVLTSTGATVVHRTTSGPIRSRADAIAALREVGEFFKQNEPHSPVGLLAERAARWAEMPLERWLASVIKDDATLGQLRELLDISREA